MKVCRRLLFPLKLSCQVIQGKFYEGGTSVGTGERLFCFFKPFNYVFHFLPLEGFMCLDRITLTGKRFRYFLPSVAERFFPFPLRYRLQKILNNGCCLHISNPGRGCIYTKGVFTEMAYPKTN